MVADCFGSGSIDALSLSKIGLMYRPNDRTTLLFIVISRPFYCRSGGEYQSNGHYFFAEKFMYL